MFASILWYAVAVAVGATLGALLSPYFIGLYERQRRLSMSYADMERCLQKLIRAKRRFLQLEYLGYLDVCVCNHVWREKYITITDFDTPQSLEAAIDLYLQGLESVVKRKVFRQLDAAHHFVYTYREYGSKAWNEIELPWGVDDLFQALADIHARSTRGGTKYLTGIYDLSDQTLGFRSLRTTNDFLRHVNVGPMTLFRSFEDRVEEVFSI